MHPEAEVRVEKPAASGEVAGSGACFFRARGAAGAPREAGGREMDTPPLSDSESEESLVSDQEVGGSGARGAGRGTGTRALWY